MSLRRPNRETNPIGISSHSTAQVRQRTQQQPPACDMLRNTYDTQYDMHPITSCRYDWNQGSSLNKLNIVYRFYRIFDLKIDLYNIYYPVKNNSLSLILYLIRVDAENRGSVNLNELYIPQTQMVPETSEQINSSSLPHQLPYNMRHYHSPCYHK